MNANTMNLNVCMQTYELNMTMVCKGMIGVNDMRYVVIEIWLGVIKEMN